jgi:prefoldin subunit 5
MTQEMAAIQYYENRIKQIEARLEKLEKRLSDKESSDRAERRIVKWSRSPNGSRELRTK